MMFNVLMLTGWDDECTELYESFLASQTNDDVNSAATLLIEHLDATRKERWSETVESINFTHSSRKAWQTINKLSDNSALNERQNLLTRLLDAVKQCQVRFGGRSELATDGDSRVSCLCSAWEAVFQHGLKHTNKALSAFKQVTELTGLSKVTGVFGDIKNLETEPVFWLYVKERLTTHESQRFHHLRQINTDAGRGRAWLRASLNEHSLERYLHSLLESNAILSQYYDEWSFMRDQERSSMLPMMAAGLGSILFAISVDKTELNSVRQPTNNATGGHDNPFTESEPLPVIAGETEPIVEKRREKRKKKRIANVISFDDDDCTISSASPSSIISPSSFSVSSDINTRFSFDKDAVSEQNYDVHNERQQLKNKSRSFDDGVSSYNQRKNISLEKSRVLSLDRENFSNGMHELSETPQNDAQLEHGEVDSVINSKPETIIEIDDQQLNDFSMAILKIETESDALKIENDNQQNLNSHTDDIHINVDSDIQRIVNDNRQENINNESLQNVNNDTDSQLNENNRDAIIESNSNAACTNDIMHNFKSNISSAETLHREIITNGIDNDISHNQSDIQIDSTFNDSEFNDSELNDSEFFKLDSENYWPTTESSKNHDITAEKIIPIPVINSTPVKIEGSLSSDADLNSRDISSVENVKTDVYHEQPVLDETNLQTETGINVKSERDLQITINVKPKSSVEEILSDVTTSDSSKPYSDERLECNSIRNTNFELECDLSANVTECGITANTHVKSDCSITTVQNAMSENTSATNQNSTSEITIPIVQNSMTEHSLVTDENVDSSYSLNIETNMASNVSQNHDATSIHSDALEFDTKSKYISIPEPNTDYSKETSPEPLARSICSISESIQSKSSVCSEPDMTAFDGHAFMNYNRERFDTDMLTPIGELGQTVNFSFCADVDGSTGSNIETESITTVDSVDVPTYDGEEMELATVALTMAQTGYNRVLSTDSDMSTSKVRVSLNDSMSMEDLKQAIITMMLRKDEVEEQNKSLQTMLDQEIEVSSMFRAEVDDLKVKMATSQEKDQARYLALQKENVLLKHQLRKYVSAVQMLRIDNSGQAVDNPLGIHLDEPQPSIPPAPSHIDYSQEAIAYEKKLIQVADMHGELMEFNEMLHRKLLNKEALIARLQQDLVELRGPLAEMELGVQEDETGDGITAPPSRAPINVWIPSAFLRGNATSAHHVYQVYTRIGDQEWNIYRRYSEFYSLYKSLKKSYPIISGYDFPVKRVIRNKDSRLVESRRISLQSFIRRSINYILQHNNELLANVSRDSLVAFIPFFG